jgi:FkbM family methyltransferase
MTHHAPDVFIHSRFESEYRRHPLVLVDVGARGGLRDNWAAARRNLRVLGFEPDQREFDQLAATARMRDTTAYFGVAVHNRPGPIRLNVARDRGLSSIFAPNREFIDAFPDATRFDTIDVQEVEADTLDNLLRARAIHDVDFLKVDTQGSELFVLEGAGNALVSTVTGVEVEVEFTEVYQGQPLFADVDAFLRKLGYLLFDLRPCYWKRAAGRAIGGPHGQIIWADALYLKAMPALRATVSVLAPDDQKSKVLRALSIALLYGYYDYALEIVRDAAALSPDERSFVEQQLRQGAGPSKPIIRFPGRRHLAAVLHRLWRMARQRDDAWSVSDPRLGNL